jgi:hypothetical protein
MYTYIQVNKGTSNSILSFLCLEDSKFVEVYSKENSNFADVPLGGLKEAMNGMRYGNMRKAVIPAYLAFGQEGLAPFIPPGILYVCVCVKMHIYLNFYVRMFMYIISHALLA